MLMTADNNAALDAERYGSRQDTAVFHSRPLVGSTGQGVPTAPNALETSWSKCLTAKLVSPVISRSSRTMISGSTVHSALKAKRVSVSERMQRACRMLPHVAGQASTVSNTSKEVSDSPAGTNAELSCAALRQPLLQHPTLQSDL